MAAKFVRTAGWYLQTVQDLVRNTLPPVLGPLTAATAWRYVYAIVMWLEESGGVHYLHLQESNVLSTKSGKDFAGRAASYLTSNLSSFGACDPMTIVDQIGKADAAVRKAQGFGPKKRDPNVTGVAFETVIQVVIGELCGIAPTRTPSLRTLQGFELAPVGYHSRPDLVLFGPRDFRLLISTKWTLRKERIGTYLHEAFFYKQRRPDLQVAFVLSEFNMNIINWLSQDPLADRVYHVNKAMLLDLHDPFGGADPEALVNRSVLESKSFRRWLDVSERVFDLQDLFNDITLLTASPNDALSANAESDVDEDV